MGIYNKVYMALVLCSICGMIESIGSVPSESYLLTHTRNVYGTERKGQISGICSIDTIERLCGDV